MTKLGIQTIIFGKRTGEDLPGVLKDIKSAGYDGVEFGYSATRTPEETLAIFGDAGLIVSGYHTGYGTFKDLGETTKQGEHLLGVGAKYFMCSGNENWKEANADDYRKTADVLNAAGESLAAMGVTLCYHNHNWEFFPLVEGGNGMDILLAQLDPASVKFCPDIYWLACGGKDPAAWLRENADRCAYFHFKDGTFDVATQQPLTFKELGRGNVDLKSAAAVVHELAPEWAITEQDNTDGDPAESARISADYARQELGF